MAEVAGGYGLNGRHALLPTLQVEGCAMSRDEVDLRERAVLATELSFTLADAQAPDQPLVWVNPAFTATTGYSLEDVVGRNCRFLQGPGTDPRAAPAIAHALARSESITTTLLNYRKDGTTFWNQVTISPIFTLDRRLTHFVGIQTDVSDRVAADLERDRALAAERIARADAEAAETRLNLMADATAALSGTVDAQECQLRLIDLVVPRFADSVVVVHVDGRGHVDTVAAKHRDPARATEADDVARQLGRTSGPAEDALRDLGLALGARSALLVPLPGRRPLHDQMLLMRGPDREQFSETDLEDAVDLGRRAGLILDNTRLYQTQQLIAETLQRSLLPALPRIAGVEVAARYLASQSGAEVGGDFYELMQLPAGAVGMVVGDVMGHDVFAAAAMGHLKGLIRACAYDVDGGSPARVLERVDQLVAGLGMPTMATALYAHLRPEAGGWLLTLSNAGHPPLVVRHVDGRCELLPADAGAHDVFLGLRPGARRETRLWLPVGTVLVGYTDGLFERRGEVVDVGLARVLAAVAEGPVGVEAVCDHLIARLVADNEDDVAVIVVRL